MGRPKKNLTVDETQDAETVEVQKVGGFSDGVVGEEYAGQITSEGSKFVVSSGSLPEGVKLDSETGKLSGVPTPESQGVSNFKVLVSDKDGNSLDEVVGQIKVTL